MNDEIENLKNLKDNWDGASAPSPNIAAINRAKNIANWANMNDLDISDIDADVLGGVAIYLQSRISKRKAWISCLNKGYDVVVLYEDKNIRSNGIFETKKKDIIEFLNGH